MGSSERWFPLSHGQEALWFLWKLVPATWAYNIVLPAGVRGRLDVSALQRSLQKLSDRHPSLRTEFKEEGGKPIQRAIDRHRVELEQIDAADWSEARLHEALRERARRPFDLEADATMRVALFRRAPDHHFLLITVHHIVSDLWSLIVLMDELRQIYPAEKEGSAVILPPLAVTFEEVVRRQRAALEGDEGERLWNFWREELSGELAVLDLPADHTRPPMQSFRGGTITRRMDAELTRKLKQLAGKERVTPYMALLTAYQVLLHRYTGQDDIVVGSPTSGRDRAELQDLAGDFVNMVPIRADLRGAPSFRELLGRVRGRVVETIKHQDYPFSLLVDRLHPARDLSRSPIFQTTFVLQRFHRFQELSRVVLPGDDEPAIPFADLLLEPVALAQQDGQFDLNLEMKEDEKGRLAGAWKYSADLFEPLTIERMASNFETLLNEIIAHPERPVAELRLLTAGESAAMVVEGHGREVVLPQVASVCELFEAQVARRGSAVAVSCGTASLTYAELGRRVTALARALVPLGVGRDVLVAVLLPRGLDFVTALLALGKAGGAFLPLDSRHPMSRTLQILEGSGTPVVLTSASVADDVARAIAAIPAERRPRVATIEDLAMQQSTADLPGVRGEDLAYVMYTSGSTGAPKGVMVEHRGMVNHVCAKLSDLGMTEDDVLAQNGPPTFDIVVWQCLAPFVLGGRVVVFPDEIAEDPAKLLAEVEKRGVTVLQAVPSMLLAVIEEAASGEGGAPALPTLRWMVPTGEALPTELCRRWLALYPHIPLLNTYGSTECSDDQCHYAIHALGPADQAVSVASIGTPICNMAAYVLDTNLAPVPVGVVGELYIGGIGVGRGYINDAERTAAAFIPDPFDSRPGARLYRTRDHARRRADRNLDFLGRTDAMIKLRGFRIEPGEIEAALSRHPLVSAAAVSAREHPSGERVLVGHVVPAKALGGIPPGVDELRQFLGERLPQYMVPSVFCFLDALPLTANGKLDQRRLPAPEWQVALGQDLVAPRSATEERLAGIWAEVLGLKQVGVTQDFFAIGGDSIRSIQIVARCKRAGIELRPSDLFQHPTIAALAALAERSVPAGEGVAPIPAMRVSQEHLDLALGQVEFDEDEP
ncbi:MAG TPA: amino acid adenylation domain-containing protein [Thermoanaerobaculia bacterium]|nr:amino acid adenylation domain-containing protein [Thermoanaerobaculia bacterium]